MWRQVWDEGVSQIYATVLGMFPCSVVGPSILHSPFQDERNPNSHYHPSQTAMRIFVVPGDTSSRFPTN